jgi:ABC-type Fe3+/spermidine/putrescine transport system ATPase subunit
VALDDVSFEVRDGEYLCVLGPTGSGKTTLLKLMAGLIKPDAGTIYFDGKPVNDIAAQDRNAVYVPQQYALFPHLTVLQNVAFGPLARGKPPSIALQIASKTLELVRLSWRAQAFPNELSGGMQQRVALARGLASETGLLLLDEPLGALDARLRLELRHKLRDLVKQSRFTAIHVTHDQDEAMSVSDEIMVLRSGRIEDYGPQRRIYRKPASIFAAHMIGGASFLEGIVDSTVGETALISIRGGLTIQAPSKNLTLTAPVILALRKERVRISRKRLEMDNVFKGEIRAVRFLGNSKEYLIRIPNGDIVASRQFADGQGDAYEVGDEAIVGFLEGDAMVFEYPVRGLRKELEIA